MRRLTMALLLLATRAWAGAWTPEGAPDATLDLGTRDGARIAGGPWRTHDTRIVETDFRSAGPDHKPSGAPNRTYDYEPHAGGRDFDDSGWETIDPTTLEARRGGGKLCFQWYRYRVIVPERVGDFDAAGSTVVLETTVDDYAEVWVDGQLPRTVGQPNEALVAGWNQPNHVLLGRNVRPGQGIQIAIFGINGPISDTPSNYVWVRSAKLLFYREPRAVTSRPAEAKLVVVDPKVTELVPAEPKVEKLAEGFQFTEGPIWIPEGYLLFSDPNANRIYRWSPDGALSVYRERSGYAGDDVARYGQPGSNGLTLDARGRLTVCEHGNRRVTRRENDGSLTVLADRYEGKRLNSPNDLAYKSDGTLYFTDPPFGLPKFFDDPDKQLAYSGVFRVKDGKVRLVARDLTGPNGLAFSPDERYLYVDDWDEKRKIVMRYEVKPDGSLAAGAVFFDMTMAPGEEALDGLKVDERGNLYVSGPGGVWILSPEGKHLGTLVTPELPANFAWGDADGRTLYLTARSGLYRVRLEVAGLRPTPALTSLAR